MERRAGITSKKRIQMAEKMEKWKFDIKKQAAGIYILNDSVLFFLDFKCITVKIPDKCKRLARF